MIRLSLMFSQTFTVYNHVLVLPVVFRSGVPPSTQVPDLFLQTMRFLLFSYFFALRAFD